MYSVIFFFQAEDGIRDLTVTGVQTCALPIWLSRAFGGTIREWPLIEDRDAGRWRVDLEKLERSEEHTSELQSQSNLVCRLLLEKKKKKKTKNTQHTKPEPIVLNTHASSGHHQ